MIHRSNPSRLPIALAKKIDYTDVRKEITYSDLDRLCLEATTHGIGTVVVPSILVGRAVSHLYGASTAISCFIGYPFGTQAASVKAVEAEEAVRLGATELEIVPHFGSLSAGDWDSVFAELAVVRKATDQATLKLVLEMSRLSPYSVARIASIAAEIGYEYVSNSLGFRIVSTQPMSDQQASSQVIAGLRQTCGEALSVKAVGAPAEPSTLSQLITAGARRIEVRAEPGRLSVLSDQYKELPNASR